MKLVISLSFAMTAALATLSGCQLTQTNQTAQSNTELTLSNIKTNVGCDASYQCKVIGVGERLTCGGPREYLIYSTKHSDEQKVEAVVSAITKNEKIENKSKKPAASCEPVMPVQTLCIAHKCQEVPL
ncbi:hypothetical protein [Pseudoalteromonas piscicida]|uniref:Lipoprotein n=1 Tax=Pseudoalteromonas piscicida TaxID=43662 RepID=A0A2A5JL12_PSEO7|nr:hypothetical protein [Pseudoalteromonas piscicida]PCK30115.1 hypothetical protein CEX98_19585 [Pseudoalteromonas piscicida]